MFLSRLLQEISCLQIWHAQWDNLYLSSLSPVPNPINTPKTMASKKVDVVLTNRGKIVSTSTASRDSAVVVARIKTNAFLSTRRTTSTPHPPKSKEVLEKHRTVITRSKAKAMSAPQHVTQAKARDVNRKRELVINLTSLGAKKNTPRAVERNSRNEERSLLGSKNSRECPLSPVSNADYSTGSCHGSPSDDQQKKISMRPSASIGESYSMAMQVMMIGVTSADEQLAHMAQAIEKLTKTIEEKDMQIASLVSKLEAKHGEESQP